MNLVIDIGNTRTKTALFNNNELLEIKTFSELLVCDVEFILRAFPQITNCILCCTGQINLNLKEYLNNTFSLLVNLSGNTSIPFKNNYESKVSQGPDRIAAIAGAQMQFPGSDVLVIDAGTAITFDFIDKKGNYNGGNISPGLEIRFKALHNFTDKLPLLQRTNEFDLLGRNTVEAINSGVQNGIIFEIEQYIVTLKHQYSSLKTIITGGDADFLANKLKCTIFADSNLVLKGLNRILNYNAQ
jgi:type III pantothenate kinase